MIKGCKICGIKDADTLNFITNHPHPPKFIGFICNYPKSSRYVELNSLKKLFEQNSIETKFSFINEEIKALKINFNSLLKQKVELLSSNLEFLNENYKNRMSSVFVKNENELELLKNSFKLNESRKRKKKI